MPFRFVCPLLGGVGRWSTCARRGWAERLADVPGLEAFDAFEQFLVGGGDGGGWCRVFLPRWVVVLEWAVGRIVEAEAELLVIAILAFLRWRAEQHLI